MTTVSTRAFYERANFQIGNLRSQAESLQSQIASGEKLERSSDDPVAAARLREISRKSRLSEVDQFSSDRATTDLLLADEALNSLADSVIRAKELSIQAASGTLSDEERGIIADEIDSIRDQLFNLGNARNAIGHALFGGEATDAAYEDVAGTITYVGTGSPPESHLGDGQSVERSVIGPEVFEFVDGGGPNDLFATLGALATALNAGGAGAVAAANTAIDSFDSGLEKVTTAQTVVGTRLAWIETLNDRRTTANELLVEEQQTVGGADLAGTITRLQEVLTVLEASQSTFVRLANLSLFNAIR